MWELPQSVQRIGNADKTQQFSGALASGGAADRLVPAQDFAELFPDTEDRVQRIGRVLKDHGQIPPVRARALIEAGALQALSDLHAVAPYSPGEPCEIRVEYKNTAAPDALRFRRGVERVDDRTIVSRADDWWTAWKQFFF